MTSTRSIDEFSLSGNPGRLLHEFPLSSRSLHDPQYNVANRLAQDVQTLARELSLSRREIEPSHPYAELLRIRLRVSNLRAGVQSAEGLQSEVLRLRSQLNNVRAEAQSANEEELLQLGTETDALFMLLYDRYFPALSPSAPSPVTTATSHGSSNPILRRTAYREQHENEFERCLEYVQIQRRILKHLDKQDTVITVQEAYKWTAKIVPRNQTPRPVQALRLCYYMRSLGFDTFAVIKPSCNPETGVDDTALQLFVTNPDSEQRGIGYDHLYWCQRIGTGEVVARPYDLRRSSRPRLTVSVGPALTDMMNQEFDERFDGMAQMRGAEA